ncbi:tyrosine-protein phosphatase non-receptor type 2-like isoform X2 [Babylonia areolata]|uniref:tyrosine-protein phosphatase non-receptor type 2-like isoform X2 n=1 Tax=Babylonia areolata TaxID=304850 RepID=UPI003FD2C063
MSSQVEQEFQEYDEERLWTEIYRRIKNESSLTTLDDSHTVLHARSVHNRPKNRYRDVSPYDHCRVVLEKDDDDDDYINASYVDVEEADRKYILTQGPLEHTCGDFWLMIWQQRSKAVIMLNRVIEKGTVKCAQYWPLGDDLGGENNMVFDDVGLRVTVKGEQDCNNFIMRWLELEDMTTEDKREVLHFHYTTWPDFGVPTSPTAFLNFLKVVRESGALERNVGPAVIHCSAGIGRSGTFCLVDSCLVLIEKHKTLSCINMRQMLMDMRSYRMGLIQTPDQLRFSYLAVIHGGRILLGQDANSNIKIPDEESPTHQPRDDVPPPPPTRVTSLPEYRRSSPHEDPSSREENGEIENLDEELAALIDDDDERPPDLPPKQGPPSGFERMVSKEADEEEESAYTLRKRIREERQKSTQEKIKSMKDRQKKSAIWNRRRSYLQPICLGLALLVGSYMFYRFYWRK